jgi:flavodoxin
MKTLIVYYSYDGNSAFIAESMKEKAGADILRLEPENEKRRAGFSKYFFGAWQVFTRKKPVLKPFTVDFSAYDLLIFGCPVWGGGPAPAMSAFLETFAEKKKKIALFCCHAGGKGRALEKMKEPLSENTIAGEIDFVNPLQMDKAEISRKTGEWLARLS